MHLPLWRKYLLKCLEGIPQKVNFEELLKYKRGVLWDSQANMVQILANTDDLLQYEGKTIKEGLEEGDVRPYILGITDNLHFIPADDFLVLINEV